MASDAGLIENYVYVLKLILTLLIQNQKACFGARTNRVPIWIFELMKIRKQTIRIL